MAREDSLEAAEYRGVYGFEDRFDVGLAASFDSDGAMDSFPLYRRVDEAITNLSKRPFLPHEVVGRDWDSHKVYDVVNRIIIPGCDLVLFYAGSTDRSVTDAGMMMQRALSSNVPVICFYEKGREEGVHDVQSKGASFLEEICFETEDEAIARLTKSMRKFYSAA